MITLVGFLPAVHNKVILEIVDLCECFGTLVTAVGFLFSWYASFSERNIILSLLHSIKNKLFIFTLFIASKLVVRTLTWILYLMKF